MNRSQRDLSLTSIIHRPTSCGDFRFPAATAFRLHAVLLQSQLYTHLPFRLLQLKIWLAAEFYLILYGSIPSWSVEQDVVDKYPQQYRQFNEEMNWRTIWEIDAWSLPFVCIRWITTDWPWVITKTFKTITIWTKVVTIDKNALGLTHQGQRHVRRIIDTYMNKGFRTLDKMEENRKQQTEGGG